MAAPPSESRRGAELPDYFRHGSDSWPGPAVSANGGRFRPVYFHVYRIAFFKVFVNTALEPKARSELNMAEKTRPMLGVPLPQRALILHELNSVEPNIRRREGLMSDHTYKQVELTGSSKKSVEEAVQNAIARPAKLFIIFIGSRWSKRAATSPIMPLTTGRLFDQARLQARRISWRPLKKALGID